MPQEKEVRLKIRALDKITNTLKRVQRHFPVLARKVRKASASFAIAAAKTKKFRDAMNKTGRSMRRLGRDMNTRVSAPVALAGAAILRTGVNFQKSINRVGAITRTIIGKEVTPQFIQLEKRAMELGRTTEFSSTQVADAMSFLGRAGFKANEILNSVDNTLALASASGMDLAFTADVMSKTIRQFGLDASESGRVADVLADVSRRTNVDLETLSETFKDAGSIAATYGLTLEQTAALTGLLGDAGIQGSKAGTTLKNIMLKLATPTSKATKMLQAMGVAVTDAAGNMRPVGDIITAMGPKLAQLNKNKQLEFLNELFGLRGIAGASALMARSLKEGKDPARTLTEILKGSTGAAKDMQQIMLRGAPKAMAEFNSALEGVGLSFARSGLLKSFTKLLNKMAELFGWITKLSPETKDLIIKFALFAAVIGPLLMVLGTLATVIGKVSIALAVIESLMVVIAPLVGLISIKFILIAAAIGLVIAGVVRLVDRWGKMVDAFKTGKGFFNSIGRFFKSFVTDVDDSANAIKRADRAMGGVRKVQVTTEEMEGKKRGLFQNTLGAENSGLKAKSALGNIGNQQNTTNTNNARVDITVNDPGGNANVRGLADDLDLFSLNTGLSGAAQ